MHLRVFANNGSPVCELTAPHLVLLVFPAFLPEAGSLPIMFPYRAANSTRYRFTFQGRLASDIPKGTETITQYEIAQRL